MCRRDALPRVRLRTGGHAEAWPSVSAVLKFLEASQPRKIRCPCPARNCRRRTETVNNRFKLVPNIRFEMSNGETALIVDTKYKLSVHRIIVTVPTYVCCCPEP